MVNIYRKISVKSTLSNILYAFLSCLACSIIVAPSYSAEPFKSVVQLQNQAEPGTGFFIKYGGRILLITAKHVLGASGEEVTVNFPGTGKTLAIPLKDQLPIPNIDAAIVIINSEEENLQTLDPASIPLVSNQGLTVWGFPITSKSTNPQLSSRSGKYLGIHTTIQDGYSIRYGASTQIGFSGGPIIDEAGRVVGIHGRSESSQSSSGVSKPTGNALGIPINVILAAITLKNQSSNQLDEKAIILQGARASIKKIHEMMTNASISDQMLTELSRAEASDIPRYCIEIVKAYYYTFFSSLPDLQRANSSFSISKKISGVDTAYYALAEFVARKIGDYKRSLDYSRLLEQSGDSEFLQFSERRLTDEIQSAVLKCAK